MNDNLDRVEQQLIAGYQEQARHYERALYILENVPDANGVAGENNWAHDLNDALQAVAELDAALAGAKAVWRQSGRAPEVELRALLDRLATQIRVLREQIDSQVAGLLARKQRLIPEIDDFIRQRWMLNAYAQSGRSAAKS